MVGQTGRSLRLSAQGIEKANTALLKFGSKADLAAQLQMSRTTINKFFTGEPVDQKKFRAICKKLKLIVEEVVDLPKTVESKPVEQNQKNSSDVDELVREVRSRCCDKILHLYSKIQLLNRQQIDVDKLYVDVYVLEKLCSEFHATIPDLLRDSNLGNSFDRLGLGRRQKRSPGFEVAAQYPRLMILGKPGSGKSTFLRHLAVACCKSEFQADHIPILVELRDIKDASQFNLLNIIHREFGLADRGQTEEILNQGKVLILLDGLDEVPGQSKRDVQDHIYDLSRQYYKNRFILTCRTQTTEYTLATFEYVEVADFNPEQVEIFAQNWFATLTETHEQGAELTLQFMAKLSQNKQTAELAVTPILLSLTCWVFNDLKNLPHKRTDLYEQGLNLLLEKWDEKRGVRRELGNEIYRKLSVEEKKKLLSYVAAHKFEQKQYLLFDQGEILEYIAEYLGISTEDGQAVLKAIEAQHGLFIERAKGIYSFSHRTFQEYLTAQHIYQHCQIEQLVAAHLTNQHIYQYCQIEQLVTVDLTNEHWEEVFLLVAGLMCGGADELLLLMEKETQQYINTPKLQTLLTWADRVTARSEGDYKPAVKRAAVIFIARRFNDYLDCEIALAIARALDSTLDHTFERDINRDFALLNNPKRDANLDFELVKALDCDYALTRVFKLVVSGVSCEPKIGSKERSEYIIASAFNRAIQSEILLIHELEEAKIFQNVNFKELMARLKELKAKLPKANQILEREGYQIVEMEVYQEFVERIYQTWLEVLNLSLETVNLSEGELAALQNYFHANWLIVKCNEEAAQVPRKTWEGIEERMLLWAS